MSEDNIIPFDKNKEEEEIDVTIDLSDLPVLSLHEDFGDPKQLLNMRQWLQDALEVKGAKFTGGGVGMGEADLDIILEGHEYNINIKPIMKGES